LLTHFNVHSLRNVGKKLNIVVTIHYEEEKNMSGCGCSSTKKKGTKAKKQVKK
jgi:hypothetical protein